ncbi:MAG: Holliday junction resolvase RuvX [Clostridia bacterium]|nr:Holliday junction resolvase RuvX [Clostridia bacterium]MBR6634858.1 Holliday junction resolvase RuvX [Clostridia bacterium]
MVILSVDYGDVRTGVAVCDKLEMLASPVGVINEKYEPKLINALVDIIKTKKPELIVVGLPKNMDGSLGFRADACTQFAEHLREACGIQTVMWDERLTSVIAHKQLQAVGKREKQHKTIVDAAAAVEILQSFIDSRKRK